MNKPVRIRFVTQAILFVLIALTSGCNSGSSAVSVLPTLEPTRPSALSATQDGVRQTSNPTPAHKPTTQATPSVEIYPEASLTASAPTPTTKRSPTRQVTVGAPATPTTRSTLGPNDWKNLPIIPPISDRMTAIYRRGLEMGNNPRAFSKIGDCGSTPAWFLGDFDRGERYYRLGEYQELSRVIQEFQGSFDRTSLAARSGFNASALFVPLWSDRTYCQAGEAPLACEYRVHRPVIAFIMLGTNDVWHPQEFEPQMRKIIEYSLDLGVIPILSTKADNQEGDGSINAAIARLAFEYEVPLWNFWAAVYPLPGHGLQEDQVHLTWGRNLFDDPQAMSKAWPMRNLTALQVLDAVWRAVTRE